MRNSVKPDRKIIDIIARAALKEDAARGDITTRAVLNGARKVNAVIISRGSGILCGMPVAERVFAAAGGGVSFRYAAKDASRLTPGRKIAFISGKVSSVLKAERTALNFIGMLSGIATAARDITDLVKDTRVRVHDTRKTIPFNRYLEKYAVAIGHGYNHRKGLWDMILIKDNHLKALGAQMKISDNKAVIKEAARRAHRAAPKGIKIEIEVETLKECESALSGAPDVIMLDNMSCSQIRRAITLRQKMGLAKKVLYEASGGITNKNIKSYAKTGVDIISIGALTSTISPLDFSLEIM